MHTYKEEASLFEFFPVWLCNPEQQTGGEVKLRPIVLATFVFST